MSNIPQTPQAPAAAYAPMAELLGDGYFLRVVPKQGVVVKVAGDDQIITEWAVTYEELTKLRPAVAAHPHLRWVIHVPYIEKDIAP